MLSSEITERIHQPLAIVDGPEKGRLFVPRSYLINRDTQVSILEVLRLLVKAGAPIRLLKPSVAEDETIMEGVHFGIVPGNTILKEDYYPGGIYYSWAPTNEGEEL